MKKLFLLFYLCCFNYAVFALSTLGNAGGSVVAGTICLPGTNSIIAEFSINQSVSNTTLTTVNFTTTGTYIATDITDFKLYANTSNSFATALQVGATIVAGLGTGVHSFSPGSPLVTTAGLNPTYYWIVADLPNTATPCNTIAVSAFISTNIVVAAGGTAGTTLASGAQTLNILPVITATASPNPVCTGSNLTLTGTGVGCNAYSWSGPSGYSSAVLNPPAIIAAAGSAGVYNLTATNICGTSVASTSSVVVNAPPTAVSATASPNPVCLGNNLTLTGAATGATTYLWTGPAGSGYSSAVLNPPAFITSALDAGVYTLTASTAAGCSAFASTAAVVIHSQPSGVTASAAPNPVCSGSNLTLTGTGVGGTAPTYTWTGPGVGPIVGLTPAPFAVTAANAGVYNLVAAVTGCPNVVASTASVVVNPLPTGVTASAAPNPLCSGSNLTLTGTATGATTYLWTGPGGSGYSSALLNPAAFAVSAADAGIFTLKATSASGCITTVTTGAVIVNALPPGITGSTTLCAGTTSILNDALAGGTWSSGAAGTATISSGGVLTGIAPGTATISYTSASGCSTTTVATILNAPAAITVVPNVASLCSGGNLVISATIPATPDTALVQNFNSGTTTWTIDNTGSVGTLGGTGWRGCGDGYINELGLYHSPDNSGFAMVNSDTSGSLSTTVSQLISPRFSLAGYSAASITFQVAYQNWPTGDFNVELDISNDGGVTWSVVKDYKAAGVSVGSETAFVTQTYSLGAFLGLTNLQARFYYNSNWGYYFAVDNVNITGTPMGILPTWTPATDLYTDAGFTTPYFAGTAVDTVYLNPSPVFTTTITTYTATMTFGGCTTTDTSQVTVFPNPGPITGLDSACVGTTTILNNTIPGGVWISSNPLVATVDPILGIVTGVSAGTDTITYSIGGMCSVTTTVNIGAALPTGVTALAAPNPVCLGTNLSLTATATGATSYAWAGPAGSGYSSPFLNPPAFVTTALDAGVYTFTAISSPGCSVVVATLPVSVNVQPTGVTASAAPTSLCSGDNLTLAGTGVGGTAPVYTWTGPGITPISGITPVPFATTIVNSGIYTLTASVAGCADVVATTAPVIVHPVPTGVLATASPNPVCSGTNLTLSGTSTGASVYLWTGPAGSGYSSASLNPPAFVCSAADAGVFTLTATTALGCTTTVNTGAVIVDPAISGITGGASVICVGGTTNLNDISGGGTWASNNAAISSVSGTGLVTGVGAGIDTISYSVGACVATWPMTVETTPSPGIISGLSNLCMGSSTTLMDGVPSGTWSVSNANCSITPTGVLTGLADGIDTITYIVTNLCGLALTNFTDTISTAGNSGFIVGPTTVCAGSFAYLTDTGIGGAWSVSNATGTIDSTGLFSALSGGVDTVYYSVITACNNSVATKVISINPLPDTGVISGPSIVCVGATIDLSETVAGGTWSSVYTTATVSPAGVVTGVTAGVDTIKYSVINACGTRSAKWGITVNPSGAGAITGPSHVCTGSSVTLSDSYPGGNFSSGNLNATITSGGILTGLVLGQDTITYTLINICGIFSTTKVITVEPLPNAGTISGAGTVCAGAMLTLSENVPGGTWTSADTAIATVNAVTGVVTGVTGASVDINYNVTSAYGCISETSQVISVNPAPPVNAITGITNECLGATSTLSDITASGKWKSSNTVIATVDSLSGVVSGLSVGTVTISYWIVDTLGCVGAATTHDTVNIIPKQSPITGPTHVCQGNFSTLSDSISGGFWSSSNTSIATIDAATGIVTGVALGSVRILYIVSNSCGAVADSTTITVNTLPTVTPISGPSVNVCAGASTLLTDATSGGAWSSSSTTIATVNDSTGWVSGVAAGTVDITYTVNNGSGCSNFATTSITFSGSLSASVLPAGHATVCHGTSVYMQVLSSGSGLTYQWLKNGVIIPGATNYFYNAGATGAYSVITGNSTCSETIAGPTVTSPATPAITFISPNLLYTGAYATYQWYRNGVAIPGANSSIYSAPKNGSYKVVVTDGSGCIDTSAVFVISDIIVNEVHNVAENNDIDFYPNPATTTINIESPEDINVTVLSPDGKIVIKAEGTKAINVSGLANGLYLIKIYNKDSLLLKTGKFTKL